MLLGGLPFMWRKAEVARNVIYDRLGSRGGDKVLVTGQCIESCGFVDDMRKRIGPRGEIQVFDITDEARDNYIAKKRGRGGQLATWAWTYTRDIADESLDCAVCLQGVQHTDDWRETGAEMLRVMKSGRNIVLTEIAYSPETRMKIELDMHIEYVFDKLLSKVGWKPSEFPYYSPQDLAQAFEGLLVDADHWKGIEIFWAASRSGGAGIRGGTGQAGVLYGSLIGPSYSPHRKLMRPPPDCGRRALRPRRQKELRP